MFGASLIVPAVGWELCLPRVISGPPAEALNIAEAAGGLSRISSSPSSTRLPLRQRLPRPLDGVLAAGPPGGHPDLVDILPHHDYAGWQMYRSVTEAAEGAVEMPVMMRQNV